MIYFMWLMDYQQFTVQLQFVRSDSNEKTRKREVGRLMQLVLFFTQPLVVPVQDLAFRFFDVRAAAVTDVLLR